MIGIVQDLGKFLQYLERGDVTELVFQSGAAAAAKKRGKLKPVTREPLSANHIMRLVSNTPFQGLVPEQDGASPAVTTEINGVSYVATMARSGPMLMLRVRREGRHTEPPKVPIGSIRAAVKSRKPANRVVSEEVVQRAPRLEPRELRQLLEPEQPAVARVPVASDPTAGPPEQRRVSFRPAPESSRPADVPSAAKSAAVSLTSWE